MDTKKIEQDAYNEKIEKLVAGAVIIHNNSILFVRRSKDDFMGGIYELPSGKVDSGENLIDALKREVLEETGLVVKSVHGLCGTFDYISKKGVKTRQFNFVVTVENADNIKLNPAEHDSYAWINFDAIDNSVIIDDMMKSIAKKAISFMKSV